MRLFLPVCWLLAACTVTAQLDDSAGSGDTGERVFDPGDDTATLDTADDDPVDTGDGDTGGDGPDDPPDLIVPDGYELVWHDEFDGEGAVDPDNWVHQDLPPNDGGWFNGELQHYTARQDNSFVADGLLHIVAQRERYTVEGSTRSFTSARLNSRFFFRYGRVEVRAMLPAAAGTWPAIWTLGYDIDERGNPFGDTYGSVGWPQCGEIDLLEQTGWNKRSTIAHFHWFDDEVGGYLNEGGEIANPDATTAFHVYALDWDDERLRVYLDDELVHELRNADTRPYNHPHYLLLNIAVGGSLGGDVPRSFDRAEMAIDYVRVFQPTSD